MNTYLCYNELGGGGNNFYKTYILDWTEGREGGVKGNSYVEQRLNIIMCIHRYT